MPKLEQGTYQEITRVALTYIANWLRVTTNSKTGRVVRTKLTRRGHTLRVLVKKSGAVDCSLTWYIGKQCCGITAFMSPTGKVILQGYNISGVRFSDRHMTSEIRIALDYVFGLYEQKLPQWAPPPKPINERPLVFLKNK